MARPAYQAADTKPIRPIGGPGQARPINFEACRRRPGQAFENFGRLGQALLRPGLPGPLGTLSLLSRLAGDSAGRALLLVMSALGSSVRAEFLPYPCPHRQWVVGAVPNHRSQLSDN